MAGIKKSPLFSITTCDDNKFKPTGLEYVLQISPEKFDIVIDEKESSGKNADGDRLESGSQGSEPKKWNFTFLIDNSGVLPRLPSGCSKPGTSIEPSVNALFTNCVDKNKNTKNKPFVIGVWSELYIEGKVSKFSIRYTFFDNNGEPIRAIASLEITGVMKKNPNKAKPQEISRIPTIKDGDNVVNFCEEFYKDKNYYLKIADINNLSSFRALDKGKRLEFPPIKK